LQFIESRKERERSYGNVRFSLGRHFRWACRVLDRRRLSSRRLSSRRFASFFVLLTSRWSGLFVLCVCVCEFLLFPRLQFFFPRVIAPPYWIFPTDLVNHVGFDPTFIISCICWLFHGPFLDCPCWQYSTATLFEMDPPLVPWLLHAFAISNQLSFFNIIHRPTVQNNVMRVLAVSSPLTIRWPATPLTVVSNFLSWENVSVAEISEITYQSRQAKQTKKKRWTSIIKTHGWCEFNQSYQKREMVMISMVWV